MPLDKKPATKKASTKAAKTKNGDKQLEGAPTDAAPQETRADLLAKIQAVEREAVKASEHRNYMQLERDKIDAFWEITKRELKSTKIDLRDIRREIDVMEEQHAMELRVQQHKLKQIEHERLEAEEAIRAEYDEMETKLKQTCHNDVHRVEDEMLGLESSMREMVRQHEVQYRKLKLEHSSSVGLARKQFEESATSHVKNAEQEMFAAMSEFKSRVEEQLRDAESRKSEHIEKLMAMHTSAYAELKLYFNELTEKHINEIETLKQKLGDAMHRLADQRIELSDIRKHNESLVCPLNAATQELDENRKRLAQSEQKNKHLEHSDRMLNAARKEVKTLKWENELIIQKLERVERELHAARNPQRSDCRFVTSAY